MKPKPRQHREALHRNCLEGFYLVAGHLPGNITEKQKNSSTIYGGNIMKTLFDYQKEIVQKANKSNALFMKMGTGKTITSLKIAEKWTTV